MRLGELKEMLDEAREFFHAHFAALQAEIATQGAMDRLGARSEPVAASRPVTGVDNVVAGHSFRETSGTTGALVQLFDGVDDTGVELLSVSLAANESARDWYGARGPSFDNGVYVKVTGAVAGAVFLRR